MSSIPESLPRQFGLTSSRRWLMLGLIWLGATLIATFFALLISDSTLIGDQYIPRTNDSFYHARRILDVAVGERGFYQFDQRLHPPDGTWIPWPWGYDYLLGKLTQVALWARPGMDPMAFLSLVPVVWIGVNAALFLGAASAIGLSLPLRLLAMLAFALSPLTQLLHGTAMIDHHFVEFSFVLATTWLGLLWARDLSNLKLAISLGVVLGLAQAFHNGLFMLQLVPLSAAFVLWLKGTELPKRSCWGLAIALIVTTQLILLPSQPYLNGRFEFGFLSWFHFYVSAASAIVLAFFGSTRFSPRRLAILAAIAFALLVPLLAQSLQGAAFVSGEASILQNISEARSPYRLMVEIFGPVDTAAYYSWLLMLTPVLLAYFGYRLVVDRDPVRLYFAAASIFGLALLLLQFRFHYFGSFAMIAGSMLLVDELSSKRNWHPGIVFVAAFAALVLAYQPPLRQNLFEVYAVASDPEYEYSMSLYLKLGEVCAEDPGLVLASNDDGNPILFHSDCSVIANNFILGAEDDAKFAEIARLMRADLATLRSAEPAIKYALIRVEDFTFMRDGARMIDLSAPVIAELVFAEQPPEGFELVARVDARTAADAELTPYAQLYKLTPIGDRR